VKDQCKWGATKSKPSGRKGGASLFWAGINLEQGMTKTKSSNTQPKESWGGQEREVCQGGGSMNWQRQMNNWKTKP